MTKKQRQTLKRERAKLKNSKVKPKTKTMKVNLEILGWGDVVFPIITAGIILRLWGLIPSLLVILGATIALAGLFIFAKKGKFYPAMPFISAGLFAGMILGYLIR